MSAAWQSGSFFLSEGQQSLAAATPAPGTLVDKNSLTFDVRQSRFNFSVKGPQVLFGATPSAVLEIDFYGGNTGGNFGNVSILPRMRTAYSELNWGNNRLQLGQQNDLIFAMAPTSLSHIGFPLGYFTGNTGWRRPGLFGFHNLPVNKDVKVEFAWEVGRSQWADNGVCAVTDVDPTTPGNQPVGACAGIGAGQSAAANGITLGEASAAPAVEGRFALSYGKLLTAFVAGHYNQVDLTGVGVTTAAVVNSISVTSYNAGAKLFFDQMKPFTVTLQGTGFVGKNVSPLIGDFIGFRLGSLQNPDVETIGWWGQAGLGFDKFSVWALYGDQKPNRTDAGRAAATGGRLENKTKNVIAMYRDGGYGLSAEWINFKTTNAVTFTGAGDARRVDTTSESKADQFMLTANYFF